MHILNEEAFRPVKPFIAERNYSEMEAIQQEPQREYLYKLFNALELPVITMSYPGLEIREFNKKALYELGELTGKGDLFLESRLTGKSLSECCGLVKYHDELPYLNKVEETKSTVYHEKIEMKKSNRRVYYNLIYQPLLDAEGEVAEVMVVGIDNTHEIEERKQMEEALKLKDEFLYFMSHEFKTPLTVINAAVQSLDNIYADQIPPKARELIDRIRRNTYRQLRLVNNLLEITRISSGHIRLNKRNIDVVLLTRALTESVAIYAQQKGVEVAFSSKIGSRIIGTDDEKLERILLNLLSNAIKFTPEGKKVEVELSGRLCNNRRMICISVKDQGIGIPKDKQELIFDRFGQVESILSKQAEGNGIGLYLAKLMIEALAGEIFLESEEGRGSVFTLMIPSQKTRSDDSACRSMYTSNGRLVQSIAIEFSDIYQ